MRILINAVSVKKQAGGVFQIATNFIMKVVEQISDETELFYIVSEDLHKIFIEHPLSKDSNYYVFPTQPDFTGSYFRVRKDLKHFEKSINPDVVYTIASPSYFSFKAPEVMRFANAWVTNPNKYAYSALNVKTKIRNRLYFINQKRLMRTCKYFITQSETVKNGILSIVKTESDNVKVIPNVLPAFYVDNKDKVSLNQQNNQGIIYIASVAGPSSHKNLEIIPDVLRYLRDKHDIRNAIFLTTLPENSSLFIRIKQKLELLKLGSSLVNYGYRTQKELIDLYSKCELCFMPTLLETFSATLLEAMFFNLAIVTTDFSFNSEIVGDAALYFKPMDAEDAANKLAVLIKNKSYTESLKSKMPKYLKKYFSFDNYIDETISFLKKVSHKE